MATAKELLADERLTAFLKELGSQIDIPADFAESRYDDDADVVYVRFSETAGATRSEELNEYIILDYRGDQLIGIEILNASVHV